MNSFITRGFALLFLAAAVSHAQVPGILNYQGRIAVGTVNFDGAGQFKFALINAAGTTSYWSNDGSSVGGSEPAFAVALTVFKGLYAVLLAAGYRRFGSSTLALGETWASTHTTDAPAQGAYHCAVWTGNGSVHFFR